jgi:type VI secretion system protein ImpG
VDRRLLRYYDLELQHLRGMGAEFAREFPKIAGRLGLESFTCADPFVERLLEGVAFLTARVHLKLDAEFPRFTQSLLETVYPHYLAPTPSMTMLQFQPQTDEPGLAQGHTIERHTPVKSLIGKGDQTACTYKTAHEVDLWPIKIAEAKYYIRELASLELPAAALTGIKAAVRIRLQTTAGVKFQQVAAKSLKFYINAAGDQQARLYEQILGHTVSAVVQPVQKPPKWRQVLGGPANGGASPVKPVGFEDHEALLPYGPRSFQGYRLLQEYFAFPQRFYMFEVGGARPDHSLASSLDNLQSAFQRATTETELDLLLLLNTVDLNLENIVSGANFALYCCPAVNLFSLPADRIHITEKLSEFQIIPDRTRPLDLEVYSVEKVVGIGAGNDQVVEFLPFYRARDVEDLPGGAAPGAYYQINRVPRVASAREQRFGSRTRYPGSELYVSLVDSKSAPFRSEIKQLAVEVFCTNRDLPLTVPVGKGETDFTIEAGGPISAIRSINGQPTPPRPSYAEGDIAWRIISHLSLNYLSLTDAYLGSGDTGAAALRDLLRLYAGPQDARLGIDSSYYSSLRKQVEGIKSIATKSIIRRINKPGPISFARGLELALTVDEINFEGAGVYLMGAVLERFFSKYVSINSFTETVLRTVERGEVMRWPARLGLRHTL